MRTHFALRKHLAKLADEYEARLRDAHQIAYDAATLQGTPLAVTALERDLYAGYASEFVKAVRLAACMKTESSPGPVE